ncbi:type II toxin-antitoxin system PemK/MazF family toxin [Candidatus Woesearchaeota archaeon]|nr:type II toxin-antitoxin system PemK/MazF family toxin [Candidatus Woesearchaeota archaeon]
MKNIKRGEIWLVNLDPTIGHEINKSRPGLIIQNDIGNSYSSITIIAPITSQNLDKIYPIEVLLTIENSRLNKNSKVLLNQIRAIDKLRLIKRIGKINLETMRSVDEAIKISLDLS